MTTATEADVQALQSEMKQLRTDLANLSETLQSIVRHGSAEAVGKAQEAAEKIWTDARSKAKGLTDEIENKPLTATVTAFGVGIILGMLFSSRR